MHVNDFGFGNSQWCFGLPLFLNPEFNFCHQCADRARCVVLAYETLGAIASGKLGSPKSVSKRVSIFKVEVKSFLPNSYVPRNNDFTESEIARMKQGVRLMAALIEGKTFEAALCDDDDPEIALKAKENSTEAAPPSPCRGDSNVLSVASPIAIKFDQAQFEALLGDSDEMAHLRYFPARSAGTYPTITNGLCNVGISVQEAETLIKNSAILQRESVQASLGDGSLVFTTKLPNGNIELWQAHIGLLCVTGEEAWWYAEEMEKKLEDERGNPWTVFECRKAVSRALH